MAKGPLIIAEVEILIAEIYRKHPRWKAPEIRNEVEIILRKHNPRLPAGWPSLSSVQKVLAIVRKKAKELSANSADRPWSIATLDDCPIPAQALPIVLEEYKQHVEKGTILTIREAKWIAQLSGTKCPKHAPYWIARTERLYEIIDKPPNFEIFDRLLADLPGQTDDWPMAFWAIASLADIWKSDPTKNKEKEVKNGNKTALEP